MDSLQQQLIGCAATGAGIVLSDIARLLGLVPPPRGPQPYPRWAEVEGRLGFAVPADYKWLVDTYGIGSFDDFLYVLQPETRFEPIRLEPANARSALSLTSLKGTRTSMPYEVDDLLLAAKTDNGDTVHWLRHPADDPDKWTIAVLEGGGVNWVEFPGDLVDYLGSTFDGSYRIPFLPEDFPSDELAFQPQPELPTSG